MSEQNKKLIVDGMREFAGGNVEILRDLVHEDFVEHAPGVPSGRDAYIAFMAASPIAAAKLDVTRVIADEEYVVVHYRMSGEHDQAVADLWRLRDGLIVEHWDVKQPVPDPALTPNGMF